jgi:fatty-acyl-CoA synthase
MDTYTLADILRKSRTAQLTNPSRTALVFEGRTYSYDELEERATRLASGLLAQGFAKGDRACILLYNRPEWLEIFFALAKLGGVMVPVNYYLKPREVDYIVRDSGATWIICEDRLWPTAEAIRADLPSDLRYVVVGEERADTIAYDSVVDRGMPSTPPWTVRTDDMFLLQYTSGTTGFPKGAVHTHSTVLWNSFHQLPDFGITRDDVFLVVPALCWAAGFHDFSLATLWAGGRVVLNPSTAFDPDAFFRTVERERITKALLVPSVLKRVLGSPDLDRYDLSSLSMIASGGEPVPVTAIEELHRRLPTCTLVQVYGLSEFPTMMIFLEAEHAIAKAGSAGRACRAAEVRIVTESGADASPGEIGEIICRSPAVMLGYYGKEKETNSTIVDGWLHTGDLGHVDEDGYIYVAGRSKDMIITGGLNVYPAEVERVIAQHDCVIEAAVIGRPDEKWGEIGEAHVVVREGTSVSEQELEELLRDEVANYKIPRRWRIREEPLPRTTSGKVQKFLLAQETAARAS